MFNVLPGYGNEVGSALGLHMDVDCIAFTGSTRVGKQIVQMAGQSNFRVIGAATTRSRGIRQGEVDAMPETERAIRTAVQGAQRMANMRVDHVRIDVYDRAGQLQRVLASRSGLLPFEAYAADLAVRADSTGAYDLAVLMQRPGAPFRRAAGRVVLFHWTPEAGGPTAARN